jgi:photosystem II stability/assembly factor-like uncharacterized protein
MRKFILTISSICMMLLISVASIAQKLDMEKLKGMKPRSIGPAAMSGRITAVDVVASNPDIMYVGAASGGVWKTVSGGITWEPVFDKETTLSIGAIAVQQDNPSVVWVGTGEGNPRNSLNGGDGIYKSLDAGKTWKKIGLEKTRHIHRVIIDPKNPNTVYVGAIGSPWGEHPERGVFKTTDGGLTWEKVLFVDNKTGCGELVMDPSNPNKLIANMWEHRRWPWTFKSGGPSSGMHITYDGGKTWTKKTDKDGLPEGDLGRMGIAIARSKPEIIYALIESKKNALYKSTDGGSKWEKVTEITGQNNVSSRPFYFWEIYVDPKNENRIYSLHTFISRSEDGGKSFQQIVGWKVHLDHHAWWIHPENPEFIVDGNDGGFNISRDGGATWHFIDNIPVGQFYHVNVDMNHPYNVYGGMQDNGSWSGPAYVWRRSGIRNSYWQEVSFGDGFDVSPDPTDTRYGYTMSQGGYLERYDQVTGLNQFIKPTHPDAKIKLRYNWNSALAQDPHDNATVYYGSQFLHKSSDKGNTWEVVSPDLSTNDKEKQKQDESGGLTMDATGAENHCTIISIAPSKVDKNVIWVGTDDGNIQVTRDGGKTWTNTSPKIVGLPKNPWVPQIQASTYKAGEAYVIVNNYRQFDYKPYLFRTRDFGATWESLVSPTQVGENNYTLSVVQDPIEPKLVFLGTENGLWVSLDEAKTWTKWTSGYPAGVPTMDMVIHPREHDLVIGTFGRALYILDDIRPLRDMAKNGTGAMTKTIHLFTAPDAYQVTNQQPTGPRFDADAVFNGENRQGGAMLSYVINKPEEKKEPAKDTKPADVKDAKKADSKTAAKPEEKKDEKPKVKYDSLTLEVFNAKNEKIRTIKQKAPTDNGLNRMSWGMTEKGVRRPSREKPRANAGEPGGMQVLPGTYKVRLSFGDKKDSTMVNVKSDPRFNVPSSVAESRYAILKDIEKLQSILTESTDRLRESLEVANEFETKMKDSKRTDLKEQLDKTKSMKDSINALFDLILDVDDKRQGLTRDSEGPVVDIQTAQGYIEGNINPITETDRRVFKRADDSVSRVINKVNAFYATTWKDYRAMMEKVNLSAFKEYQPLKK